mgnify:CR=1 FL=1
MIKLAGMMKCLYYLFLFKLKDLLSHHKNGEIKLKDLNYFTAMNSQFTHSRCFFVVKTDESKDVLIILF